MYDIMWLLQISETEELPHRIVQIRTTAIATKQ